MSVNEAVSDKELSAEEGGEKAVVKNTAWMNVKEKVHGHLRRHWAAYVILSLSLFVVKENYRLVWSYTPSLPYTFFVIHIGELPKNGEYAAFKFKGEYGGKKDRVFLKEVAGVQGNSVSLQDRTYLINGFEVGTAKEKSLKGDPLKTWDVNSLPEGKIPYGKYYMRGHGKDSFDSRYEQIGLVGYEQIVGKATPLTRIFDGFFDNFFSTL